jgi:hypothetical protein
MVVRMDVNGTKSGLCPIMVFFIHCFETSVLLTENKYVTEHHALNANRRRTGDALRFLNLRTRFQLLVSFMLGPNYT